MNLLTPTFAFALLGMLVPMEKAVSTHSRPMKGWLMTYAKIREDGQITETQDREGHTVEAARELGRIDWAPYLKGAHPSKDGFSGVWNDTHRENVVVGLPDGLAFHDGTTALSKAEGKIGFHTLGHLLNRRDPSSWAGLRRTPTPEEFERADHFWELAEMLKGSPRPLGLSAHGEMALSPCKKRIIFARVRAAAVCELPQNPDATLEPMEFGRGFTGGLLRQGMVGANPCGACRCPPGACENLLIKGGDAASIASVVPEDLEGAPDPLDTEASVRYIVAKHNVPEATARRWIASHLRKKGFPHGQAVAC